MDQRETGRYQHPGVRRYALVCLGALVVLFLALMQQKPDVGSAFPVLVGGFALLIRWRLGPVALLIALAGFLVTNPSFRGEVAGFPRVSWSAEDMIPVVLTTAATMAYVASSFRMHALLKAVFTPDPRLVPRWWRRVPVPPKTPLAPPPGRRDPGLVGPTEVTGLIVVVVTLAVLAWVAWEVVLTLERSARGERDIGWLAIRRSMRLIWLLGPALLLTVTAIRHVGRLRLRRAEAEMILQDAVWGETRREQARLNRWVVWGRRGED